MMDGKKTNETVVHSSMHTGSLAWSQLHVGTSSRTVIAALSRSSTAYSVQWPVSSTVDACGNVELNSSTG